MTVSRRQALFAAGLGLPTSGIWVALAEAQAPPAPAAGAAPAAAMGEDPLLAACLLLGGKRQIATCQWAKEKLQHKDCQAFAQAEIDEHVHIKAQLAKLGYVPPALPAGAAVGAPPTVVVGKVAIPSPAANLVLVDNEVKDQCIANYKKEMARRTGLKFDKAFVGDHLHEHYGLLDRAQVFSRHASATMQPVLKEGLTIITKHIATLEQLMDKLDSQAADRKEK